MHRARRLIGLLLLCALAAGPSRAASPLPPVVAQALKTNGIPLESTSIYVQEAAAERPVLAINPERPMNPASVMKLDGPSIHPSILTPLLWMAVALLLLYVLLVLVRTETEIDRRRLEAAERQG